MADNVIPLPVPLPDPPPGRLAAIWAASDQLWPEYEAALEAQEQEMVTDPPPFSRPPRLRLVK